MKKIAWAILLIAVVVIAFFQYKHYVKYSASDYFNYKLNDSIDVNFYDEQAVLQYYKNAYELGSFARQIWVNHGVDINIPEQDKEISKQAVLYYQQLWAATKMLEKKLILSAHLKSNGLDNKEIKLLFEEGIDPAAYSYKKRVEAARSWLGLKIGDVGQEVWELQQLLIKKGYTMPQDGTFGVETQTALKEFQKSKNLFPSGKVNLATIKELVK